MTVYMKRNHASAKWLVALIVFLLALGITFTDVYGYTPGNGGGSGNNHNNCDQQNLKPNNPNSPDNPPPTAIPEPTTLLLLGGGLGAMYAVRRWRKTDA